MRLRPARRTNRERSSGGAWAKIGFVEIGMDGVHHRFIGGLDLGLANRSANFGLRLLQ